MVVATRTVGNLLDSSKDKAADTEAQKIVSKAYEDIETNKADTTYNQYTYKTATAANRHIKVVDSDNKPTNVFTTSPDFIDGTYTVTLTVNSSTGAIESVCLKNSGQSDYYGYTISNDNNVGPHTLYTNAACTTPKS